MATFKEQIEALVGSTDNTQVQQWLDDGVKDVVRRMSSLDETALHLFSADGTSVSSNAGESVKNSYSVTSVKRGSKIAKEIPASDRFSAADSTSLKRATAEFPVYYILNGKLFVVPDPVSTAQQVTSQVVYGSVSNWDTGSSSVANFPDDFYPVLVLYASIKVLQEKLESYAGLPTDIVLPQVPVAPSLDYSLTKSITAISFPNGVELPTYVPIAPPVISNLDLDDTIPTAPDKPSFVYEDMVAASITETTISDVSSPPTYTPPVLSLDYTFLKSAIETEEDPELASAEVQKMTTQISEFQARVQDNLNEFNEANTEFQRKVNKASQDAQFKAQELLQEAAHTQDAEKQNRIQRVQTQIQNYTNRLSQYGTEMQEYQAKINVKTTEWTSNNIQRDFAKWQTEFQGNLGQWQADAGAVMQKFSADVARESGKTQAEVSAYGSELQRVSAENSAKLQKYSAELSSYGSDVQARVQEFTTKLQKATTDYQWISGRLQYLVQEYEKGFLAYKKGVEDGK